MRRASVAKVEAKKDHYLTPNVARIKGGTLSMTKIRKALAKQAAKDEMSGDGAARTADRAAEQDAG